MFSRDTLQPITVVAVTLHSQLRMPVITREASSTQQPTNDGHTCACNQRVAPRKPSFRTIFLGSHRQLSCISLETEDRMQTNTIRYFQVAADRLSRLATCVAGLRNRTTNVCSKCGRISSVTVILQPKRGRATAAAWKWECASTRVPREGPWFWIRHARVRRAGETVPVRSVVLFLLAKFDCQFKKENSQNTVQQCAYMRFNTGLKGKWL